MTWPINTLLYLKQNQSHEKRRTKNFFDYNFLYARTSSVSTTFNNNPIRTIGRYNETQQETLQCKLVVQIYPGKHFLVYSHFSQIDPVSSSTEMEPYRENSQQYHLQPQLTIAVSLFLTSRMRKTQYRITETNFPSVITRLVVTNYLRVCWSIKDSHRYNQFKKRSRFPCAFSSWIRL